MSLSHAHDRPSVLLPPFLAGRDPAAENRARSRLGRLLRRLIGLAMGLTEQMGHAALRQQRGGEPIRFDLLGALNLVARAVRWTQALRERLAAESKAARATMERAERLLDPPEPEERFDYTRRPKAEPPPPDDCIAGKTTAEVVAQICADLDAAAALIGDGRTPARIAAIAKAARALLGGADAAAAPQRSMAVPAGAGRARDAAASSAPCGAVSTRLDAPDSG
jgi:cell division septation protein DedD